MTWWILVLASCSSPEPEGAPRDGVPSPTTTDSSADTGTVVVQAVEAMAMPSEHVPSVFHVVWESSIEGVGFVEFGLDGSFDRRTPDTALGTAHQMALLGLKGGRRYQARAVVVDADGERAQSAPMSIDVPVPPGIVQSMEVVVRTEAATDGFVFTSVHDAPFGFVGLVDADGDWVWWSEMEPGTLVTQVAPSWDGTSLLWLEYDGEHEEGPGRVVRAPIDGSARRDFVGLRTGHHGFVEHPDGSLAWLGADWRSLEADGAGPFTFLSDRLYEWPLGATEPQERFNFFDHFDMEPSFSCKHIERRLLLDVGPAYEWTHTNSMSYVLELDSWIVTAKKTDWALRIDRASGEVVWVLHGPGGDFEGPGGEDLWPDADGFQLWSHGHMSDAWDGGMLMFDNGDHRTPARSTIAEIAWDESTLTAERVWGFAHPDGAYTRALGDARRMDHGHIISAWGRTGEIMEVTKDKEVVFRLRDPKERLLGRVRFFEDLYALPAPH